MRSAQRPCNKLGCPTLTRSRFCDEHSGRASKAHDRHRGNAASRGYDYAWQRVQRIKRQRNPLCEPCEREGLTVPMALVDHKIPIAVDRSLRLVMDNLESQCRNCHAEKTAADMQKYPHLYSAAQQR